jgi:ATP-dependent RNA helicase RhlE
MLETPTSSGFEALSVAPYLLPKLERHGIVIPTPIQARCIPVACEGRDVIGIAQTGTGKTLAFALPLLTRLQPGQFALVLAPTRELAEQISRVFQMLEARVALLIGGEGYHKQKQQLRSRPQVVIATPGRTEDHLMQRSLYLDRASFVVLDEVDRMLDMGFSASVQRILDQTPTERQTLIFSATMPKEIAALAAQYLVNPERIEIAPQGTPNANVTQEVIYIPHEDKRELLAELLDEHEGTILVFSRTRHGARKVALDMASRGHKVAEIHADRTQGQRRQAMEGFRNGQYRVLVATDIAARGIDVKDIGLVINYDVPDCSDDYIHRIGRTGRAGRDGHAIMFATPQQVRDVRDIERLLRQEIPLSEKTRFTPAPRVDRRPQRSTEGATTEESRPARTYDRPRRDERPSYGPRPENRSRPFEDRKPYAPRPENRDNRDNGYRPENRDNREGSYRPENRDNRDNRPWQDRKPYENRDNRESGYRPQENRQDNRDSRPWQDRKPYENRDNRDNGYRPQENRDSRPWQDRKPYENRDNRNNGYRPQENRDNRDNRPWQDRKPYENRDNREGGYRQDNRESRPWQDRKPYENRDNRGNGYRPDNRDSRPWQDRKPYENRDNGYRPQENRQDNRDSRPWQDRKPFENRDNRDSRPNDRADKPKTGGAPWGSSKPKSSWGAKPKHKKASPKHWPKDQRAPVEGAAPKPPMKAKSAGSAKPTRSGGAKVAKFKR